MTEQEAVAYFSNSKLNKLIESWPVVYSFANEIEWSTEHYIGGKSGRSIISTKKARLAFVEEIKKESCSQDIPEKEQVIHDKNSPMKFVITRTEDNNQLGLSVLIESLKLGETKVFIDANEYEAAQAEIKIKDQALEQFEYLVVRMLDKFWYVRPSDYGPYEQDLKDIKSGVAYKKDVADLDDYYESEITKLQEAVKVLRDGLEFYARNENANSSVARLTIQEFERILGQGEK
jgi:hypothetical protein